MKANKVLVWCKMSLICTHILTSVFALVQRTEEPGLDTPEETETMTFTYFTLQQQRNEVH